VITQLLNYYYQVSPKDEKESKRWYREARKYCKNLSAESGLRVENVTAIVSALSPSVSWDINQRDAREFILSGGVAGVSTYGQQVKKAFKLFDERLTKEDMLKILNGDKTKSFFLNMLHPMTSGPVTGIDPEKYIKVQDRKGAKEAYREAAELVGLRPHELQAVVWEYVRKEGY